jgi:hypothetical protein
MEKAGTLPLSMNVITIRGGNVWSSMCAALAALSLSRAGNATIHQACFLHTSPCLLRSPEAREADYYAPKADKNLCNIFVCLQQNVNRNRNTLHSFLVNASEELTRRGEEKFCRNWLM